MNSELPQYGQGAATFNAVGKLTGLKRLVTDFYKLMQENPKYSRIREMHPNNLTLSVDKLVCFLSGWMGGEALYQKKYGGGGMPKAHMHLKISLIERDLWLACMREALEKQNYPDSLIEYLMTQLAVPAERIRQACL